MRTELLVVGNTAYCIVPFLWNVENDFESYFLALQGHRVYERSFLGKKIDMYLPNSNHKWTHNNRISSSKSDLEHPVHHHSPFREDMSNGSHFYGRCGDKYRSFEFEQNEEKDNKKQQRMKLTLLIHNIIPPKKGREKLQEYIYPSSVNDFFASLCLLSCQRMQSISVFYLMQRMTLTIRYVGSLSFNQVFLIVCLTFLYILING